MNKQYENHINYIIYGNLKLNNIEIDPLYKILTIIIYLMFFQQTLSIIIKST